MTLHVARFGYPPNVVMVGDRLLTTGDPGSAVPWYQYANKTVVAIGVGFDAIVSFAGLAHIDSRPTDEWLATQVSGIDLATEHQFLLRNGNLPEPLALPTLIRQIAHGLERDLPKRNNQLNWRQRRYARIEVALAGRTWQRRVAYGRGKIKQFAYVISHSGRPGTAAKIVNKLDSREDGLMVFIIGARSAVIDEALQKLTMSSDDKQIEAELVQLIRDAAATPQGGVIGTECMAVCLTSTRTIRFHRTTPDSAPLAFTPFIITNHAIVPPAAISAMSRGLKLLGVEYEIVPPYVAGSGNTRSGMTSQPPKTFP